MGDASEVVREVGVNDFRVATEQQPFHLDHRLLGIAPGRYAYCSGGRSASKIGSSTSIAAVMQTRSRTVEIPSGLSLPLAFSMNTRLIGSGRYFCAGERGSRSLPPDAPDRCRNWPSAMASPVAMSRRLVGLAFL